MNKKQIITKGDTSWFIKDRFGLFIHWGLYALPARHEWVKHNEKIPDEEYEKYFEHFNPDLYDPSIWAKEAKNAGMKYFVITTKHHEGFCLWDSKLTNYKATKTPYGKDLLKPMLKAFRDEGLKAGFYHSLIDWHHPDLTLDGFHPMRDNLEYREKEKNRDMKKYNKYLHGQVNELLTQYGKIDIIWLDFSYSHIDWGWSKGKGKNDWQSEKLVALVRKLQPHIVMNDRLEVGGDIKTPEQFQPREWLKVNGKPVVWEACQTLNGSWGYDRDNFNWKPVCMLIRMLIDTVSKGGNLLLNVGPNARGEFEPKAVETLREIGRWMRLHNKSIYNCTASDFTPPPDCRYTQNGKKLYLHIFSYPFKHLYLDGLADKVEYTQFLNDASEVKMFTTDPNKNALNTKIEGLPNTLILELPIRKPDVEIPVVELFLK
jgi:alpha-L-fucosidase